MKLKELVDATIKEALRVQIEAAGGNLSKAARELCISRPTLYRLFKKYFSDNERLFLTKRVVQA